jgi:hypothetical protein
MFEDMLAYRSGAPLTAFFPEPSAADLDEDARRFYLRMTSDIAAVSAGTRHPSHRTCIARMLLAALAAPSWYRAASWRRLYHEISSLVTVSSHDAVPLELRREFVLALGRLHQFLSENVDFADALAIERLGG